MARDQFSRKFRSSLLGGMIMMGLLCASLLVVGIGFLLLDRYRWKEAILLLTPTLWFAPVALRKWTDYREGLKTASGRILAVRQRGRRRGALHADITFAPADGGPVRLAYNSRHCPIVGMPITDLTVVKQGETTVLRSDEELRLLSLTGREASVTFTAGSRAAASIQIRD